MTKCSNQIVLFNGPLPDTPVYLRFTVQSATLQLFCNMRSPEELRLGFDVEALAHDRYGGPDNKLSFKNYDVLHQVITATGPELLDGYTINFTQALCPDRDSPAMVYTDIHEVFETFKLSLTSIAGDRYLMECEGKLEGSYFQCNCEARFQYLRILDSLPANIEKLEERARRCIGPINTTIESNEHTIYFDAMPAI